MVKFMASFMAMIDHATDVEPRRHPNHPIPDDIAFSSEVDTGSHSNQVYADCADLSAVENASNKKT
jgi:hypothetical protein